MSLHIQYPYQGASCKQQPSFCLDRKEAGSRIESTFEALRAEATARLRPSLNIVTVEGEGEEIGGV